MSKPAPALSKPLRPKVIILEDHDRTANDMCHLLITNGMICHSVGNITNLVNAIQEETYDAASVDWDISGTHRGLTALMRLAQFERPAGKVVYSVFAGEEKIRRIAENKGADYVLEKRLGETEEEYLRVVQNAARLGLARRISDCLKKMGQETILESSSPEQVIDTGIEIQLFNQARRVVYEAALSGQQKGELMELLKRRGWWREFDAHSYSQLPSVQRLAKIARYAGVTVEDLSTILNLNDEIAGAMLDGNLEGFDSEAAADRLLSVLAYVLRLSRYEPELMSYYWNAKGLFRESTNPPPWDKAGLSAYLKHTGIAGINDALFWIRRN